MSEKNLIAYFTITGNTRKIAESIKEVVGGDLFEIKPKLPYVGDYNNVVKQAKVEQENDVKPELVEDIDISKYDNIYIGSPVWWYTFAPPVKTFLTSHEFKGKTVIPFCTHGGAGAATTYTDVKNLTEGANVLEGFTSYENSATQKEVENWLSKLN